jgi:Icc-related predicted phosphoesterase
MRALVICDKVEPILYSAAIKQHVGPVELIISCGDLPHYYLDFITSTLGKPTYFVYGNHGREVEYQVGKGDQWQSVTEPSGADDLHGRTVKVDGLLMAGLEGSMRYNDSPRFQYTDFEMWRIVYGLAPKLFMNRFRYGRYLDVLVTHSPPYGIHDQPDLPHNGFRSFLWLMRWARPRYLLHGHIHIYRRDVVTQTRYHETDVINTYPYKIMNLEPAPPITRRKKP